MGGSTQSNTIALIWKLPLFDLHDDALGTDDQKFSKAVISSQYFSSAMISRHSQF